MVAGWLTSTTLTLLSTSESSLSKVEDVLSANELPAFARNFVLTMITLAVLIPSLVVSVSVAYFVHLVTKCWATCVMKLRRSSEQRST